MTLIEELKLRESYFDTTDPAIEEYLENNKVTFYLGCDPTGDSLHVGHLFTYIVMKRMEQYGHHPVLLVGGATGLIGDPKMQGERKMLTLEEVKKNALSLKNQIHDLFGVDSMVDNYDWVSQISLLDFLRDIGKEFNVSTMLNKDVVKSRLDVGISFTEFSYQILQALDWYKLYKDCNCTVQLGGQDQWGNITAGSDLIRKKCGSEAKVYGLTVPLILKSDGTKFGKSEDGKSVWLDEKKTSPYEFYQFWMNIPDSDVIKRLKQFTFLSLEEIALLEKEMNACLEARIPQKRLAFEVTSFVFGKEKASRAKHLSEALFSGKIESLSVEEIEMSLLDLPHLTGEISLLDALVSLKLASSKREAREFIQNGAVSLFEKKITDMNLILSKDLAKEGRYILIKRGKKKYAVICF